MTWSFSLDPPQADWLINLFLAQLAGYPMFVFRLDLSEEFDIISLMLVINHLVVDTAKQYQIIVFVERFGRRRRRKPRTLRLSGENVAFVTYD